MWMWSIPNRSLRKRLNLRDSGALPETARGEQPQERLKGDTDGDGDGGI